MALAGRAPQPTPTPSGGSLDQRLSQLAMAVSRKADVTSEPTYQAVRLVDSLGQVWRVTVLPNGQLRTEVVTR